MSGSGTRFVALLRGVNVGRANRVPMAELRELLESLGCSGVRTLLNSGNAVFDSREPAPTRHAERIRAALLARLDVDAPVIVKSAREMAAIVAGNRLAKIADDDSRLLVAFTGETSALGMSRIGDSSPRHRRFELMILQPEWRADILQERGTWKPKTTSCALPSSAPSSSSACSG